MEGGTEGGMKTHLTLGTGPVGGQVSLQTEAARVEDPGTDLTAGRGPLLVAHPAEIVVSVVLQGASQWSQVTPPCKSGLSCFQYFFILKYAIEKNQLRKTNSLNLLQFEIFHLKQ